MKIRKQSRFAAEVSTSSLNDIMFFLLLFFLIISTMANPNVIRLLLPKAKTTTQMHEEQIVLSITAEKQYFVDNHPVPYETLEQVLTEKSANKTKEPVVLIRADKELKIQDLVDVMSICTKLKLKMVLGTEKT